MHRLLCLYRLLALSAALAVGGALSLPAQSQATPPGIRIEPESPLRIRIQIPASEIEFQKTATGGQVVALQSGSVGVQAPGAPDLPLIPVVLWVDEGFRVTGVRVVSQTDVPLGSEVIAPVAKPVMGGLDVLTGPEVRAADPVVYGADRAFPTTVAQTQGDGWMRGRRLAYLTVSPVRWNPVSRELVLATELVLEIKGEPDASRGLKPRPAPWDAREDAELSQQVIDLRSLSAARLAPPVAPEPEAFWSPTYRPSLDGSPVEYVIVTNAAMAPAFQTLADWKTKRGTQAVVRTVEWIRQTYPNGVDQAEQLRTFLRDAYENWGTVWVLLGGDTDVVPVRYANHYINNPPDELPADYYFGCLDGNWNANGDAAFGKAGIPPGGDSVDLVPELNVGRATVSTSAQAAAFADKVIDYERGEVVNPLYPNSALLLCERLSPSQDGAIYGEAVRLRLPAGMRVVRMYEEFQDYPGAIPLSRNPVLDSLNAGFGIVHHVGHGFRNTMAIGSESLGNSDIDNLVNGPRQSVVYAINCASAAIDFNSIGERFIKNPQGGGVAYIGCSRNATSGEAGSFQNEFYEIVFQDSTTAIGKALSLTKLAFVPISQAETLARWFEFALILIGDPEMPIWRRAPNDIMSSSAGTFAMGSPTYTVTATVGGSPLGGAHVVLAKTGEVIASGVTNSSGVAVIPWRPHTTGSFTVTVSKPDYRPSERTATVVNAVSTFLFVDQTTVNDDSTPPSNGNGDGFVDAGERVEFSVRVRNGGVVSATGVNAILSVQTGGPNASIVNGSVSYGTIGAGGQSSGSGNFVVDFSPTAPDAFQPTFQIAFTSGQGASADVFVLPMRGVELEHYSHILSDQPGGNGNGVPEPGEALTYRVTMRNTGNGRADQLAATLRVLNRNTLLPDPQVTVTDPNATFGTIASLATAQGDPVGFTLNGAAVVANLLVELTFSDSQGPRGVQRCDLMLPDPVTNVTAEGTVTSIRLSWTQPVAGDVRGYDIYRSPTGQGNWARINSFTGLGSAMFEDPNLTPLTRYFYYVVARDSSFNESTPSAQIAATTTPPLASGWPIETGQETSAGIVIDDLDRDGDFELVTGADAIYAWHHDGAEIRDGDQNPITSGVFSTDGQDSGHGFHSTPATADLTGDGDMEIVGLAWHDAKVYVWNLDGSLEPGWPQDIDGDFNWSSPVIADLDFDGKMEIIAASGLGGKIYAWHDNGLEVVDGDQNPFTFGIFYVTGTSFLYSSPAVGNIDGDLNPEIVIGTQGSMGKVIALNHTGTLVPGWPINTMGQITASPALADLDGDGSPNEVIIASESDSVYVFRGDATNYPGWPRSAMVNTATSRTSSPVVADINADGNLDIIFAANNGQMHVWNRNGTPMPGWGAVFFGQDVLGADATQSTPTVADIDGDHQLEVVLGAENQFIYGWNHDGTVANGFPITVGAEQRGGVTIWDLDADGKVELAATCNDRSVYVWDMAGEFYGDRIPWPYFRHDARNTGCFSTRITIIGIDDQGPGGAPAASFVPVLYPAQPNPFNPATHIRFLVPGETGATRPVKLQIFDVAGRVVRDLIDGPYTTGEGNVVWDGRMGRGGRAPSGSYFMRLEVGGKVLTGKLTLLQ